MIKWYVFLRSLGYSKRVSLYSAVYNNKYWTPEGSWPYGIKKKIIINNGE